MVVLGWALAGALASAALWRLLRPTFTQPLFMRENFRGQQVPVGAGLVVVLALVAVAAAVVGLSVVPISPPGSGEGPLSAAVALSLGFGLLGFVDDVAAGGTDRGFAGHLSALRHGRLTTGGLKLLGGGCVAIITVGLGPVRSLPRHDRLLWLLVDAALIALAANLANLFDRGPGRCTKVSLVGFAAVVAVSRADVQLSYLAAVVGAAVGLLWADLREQLMLGDAGANPLGAAVGCAVVITAPPWARAVVAGGLLTLNLASERVSFGRVIDRVPPLRTLDRLGRRPPP